MNNNQPKITVIDALMGKGKAQTLNSNILTINGYVKMKDIQVGDYVIGEDGLEHKVLKTFYHKSKDIYRVTFSDDTYTECCDEHLWTYQHPQDKSTNKFRTKELREIMTMPLYKNTNRGDKNWQFFIPLTKPVQFNEKELDIHPYLLGVLIGDGTLSNSSPRLTNSETDIIERLKKVIPDELKIKQLSNTDNEFIISKKDNDNGYKNILKQQLNNLGLTNKTAEFKFIPKDYKFNSVDNRVELLRGLIDTDGEVYANTISYSTTSKQLAEDIKFIVETLGGTCKIGERQTYYTYKNIKKAGLKSYRLYIKMPHDIQIFSSKKHLSRYKKGNTNPKRNIKNITYIGKQECKCIYIDNPTHLYLTDNCIVTHNTTYIYDMIENNNGKYVFITPYLDEVERTVNRFENNINKKFYEPFIMGNKQRKNANKLNGLEKLVNYNLNIASTHALFKTADTNLIEIFKDKNYTLVLDEVMNVIEQVDIDRSDVTVMFNEGFIYLDENNKVYWNPDREDYNARKFRNEKNLIKNSNIYCYGNTLFLWLFPIEVFNCFKEVYVLTYMFDGQIQKSYYDYYNVQYDMKTLEVNSLGNNTLVNYYNCNDNEIKKLISILDNPKMNEIGKDEHSLSHSWFKKDKNNNSVKMKELQENLKNYYNNTNRSAKSDEKLWTTYKDYETSLKGSGYAKNFLSCNIRATNKYIDTYALAYCLNFYSNPLIKNYFNSWGIKIDEDKYALSMMLQWLWRSRIRRGEPINIYIPSKRMRNLLISWLNNEI